MESLDVHDQDLGSSWPPSGSGNKESPSKRMSDFTPKFKGHLEVEGMESTQERSGGNEEKPKKLYYNPKTSHNKKRTWLSDTRVFTPSPMFETHTGQFQEPLIEESSSDSEHVHQKASEEDSILTHSFYFKDFLDDDIFSQRIKPLEKKEEEEDTTPTYVPGTATEWKIRYS